MMGVWSILQLGFSEMALSAIKDLFSPNSSDKQKPKKTLRVSEVLTVTRLDKLNSPARKSQDKNKLTTKRSQKN
jgi:hypothetical protein